MRLLLLFLPLVVSAQTPDNSQRVTEALISEIQQLRLAIERSALFAARTQLAVTQLQMHETAAARLNSQLADVRSQASSQEAAILSEKIREMESKKAAPGMEGVQEQQIRELKLHLEEMNAREQQRAAREGELVSQSQSAQIQVSDTRARIADLEKTIDTAIQQLLRQK